MFSFPNYLDIDYTPLESSYIENLMSNLNVRGLQGRRWCFTINNYTDEEKTCLLNAFDVAENGIRYLVFQAEQGENGTPHVQGYVEFTRVMRFNRVKRVIGDRCHLEQARGSSADNKRYCTKEDTRIEGPFEFGQSGNATQGTRNDLVEIKRKIDEGALDRQLWDEHFSAMVKFHRGINVYKMVKASKRNWKTDVIVCFGPPGTGKSRWCLESYNEESTYWKQRGTWFDGYNNHENVIIDDFYGWLPYDTLLRMCDRYPMQVESKGGHINFIPKVIVITSNEEPAKWYKNITTFEAFCRRVTKWIHFSNEMYEFDNYRDFLLNING